MNIADRSQANRAGWETRRKKQAAVEEALRLLEAKTIGVEKIKIWRTAFIKYNSHLFREHRGATPMGHDSGASTTITRGKAYRKEFFPGEYFEVDDARWKFGFGEDIGAVRLACWGTTIRTIHNTKTSVEIANLQEYLGS